MNTGGYFSEKEVDNLTVKQIKRLIEWLISKGFNLTEIKSCLDYICNDSKPNN